MKQGKLFLAVPALFIFLSLPSARASDASEFSADMVSRAEGKTMQMKMYLSEGKVRMETPEAVTIARPDLGVSWVLMSSEKMYLEQPMDPTMAEKTSKTLPGEFERTSMGEETVDGEATEKFKVSFKNSEGEGSIYQWIRKTDGLPARVEALDGSWSVDYKNIQTGPQAASLFEVPEGYQKMNMPNMADLGALMSQET